MAGEISGDIDLLMASLRADAGDAHALLQALAVKLDGALPGAVQIVRHGGLFSHDHPVRSIMVDLQGNRYSLTEERPAQIQAQRTRVVRGIALKTEQLGLDEWLAGLAIDLASMAEGSARGREALERLLLGHEPGHSP